MPVETIEEPLVGHPARRLALDPYVLRIRGWCHDNARIGCNRPIGIRLGTQSLTLEPPEFNLILRSSRGEGPDPTGEGNGLPVEIMGLLTKSLEDLAKLRASANPTSRDVFELQAELMLDSAMGAALLAETDRRIEAWVVEGEATGAKSLTTLRHRMRRAISEIFATISESERRRAQDLAGSLTDLALDPEATSELATKAPDRSVLPTDEVEEEPSQAAADEPAPSIGATLAAVRPAEHPGTIVLGVAVVLALALRLGIFGLAGAGDARIQPLTVEQLGPSEALASVEAYPPSLYVTVRTDAWASLSPARQLSLVEDAGRVLAKHDYSGAVFQADGRPVARWLSERGPELIGLPEPLPASIP